MNWCEGLMLRSGNTACKDWQAAIDQKKITPPFIFIKEQMISTRKASSPAESRRNSPGFQVFNIENVLHNLRRSHGAARRVGFAGADLRGEERRSAHFPLRRRACRRLRSLMSSVEPT